MMMNTGSKKFTQSNCVIENTNSSTKDYEREKKNNGMKWSQQNNTPKHNYFIGSKRNER